MTALLTTLMALDGIHNIRDLGGLPCTGGRQLRLGRVYRGCGMSGLSAQGRSALMSVGFEQVIDLRSQGERKADPGPFHDHPGQVNIPVFDGLAPLPEVFGANDAADLGSRYIRSLETSASRFALVFSTLAQGSGPVLFHCSAGKDRTGLVAALLLELVGVPRDLIVQDYAATGRVGAPLLSLLSQSARQNGMNDVLVSRMMASPTADMERVLSWLDKNFGGAEGYLIGAGLNRADLAALSKALIRTANLH